MGRAGKVGLVIGGYVAAIVASVAAGKLYDWRMSKMPYDTSGGMYAAGEAMSSLAVFFVVALVPTLLALWFVRRHETFWNVVAVGSLSFAAVSLLAVLATMVFRSTPSGLLPMLVTLLGLSQLLGVPLWLVAFVLFAFIAPTPEARKKLRFAVNIELVIGACAFVHWFVLGSR